MSTCNHNVGWILCSFCWIVLLSKSWAFQPFQPSQPLQSSSAASSASSALSRPSTSIHSTAQQQQQQQQEDDLWSLQQLTQYATSQGVNVTLTTLGPGYRSVARTKTQDVLGYVEGFVRPTGQILHLDKMEVFQPQLKQARKAQPGTAKFGGVSFGVGLLMGYRCLLHAKEKGCTVGEFLAIDDEEFQHKRLVRYYRRVGFQVVKYVGEDIGDIPDRLVWGGCGTLMKEDVDVLMRKWSALMTRMAEKDGVEIE